MAEKLMEIEEDLEVIFDFAIENIEAIRQAIRHARALGTGGKNFALKDSPIGEHLITILKADGYNSGNTRYEKQRFKQGGLFYVRSAYIGKRGDVIFQFAYGPASSSNEKMAELPFLSAIEILEGFEEFLKDRFLDKCRDRLEERRKTRRIAAEQAQIRKHNAVVEKAKVNENFGCW